VDNFPIVGDRRGGPRQIVNSPVYANLGPSASGFLCDISEGGLAIDVFGRIMCNQVVRLAFDLPDTNYRIEAIAQILWTSELARRAGLKFVDISEGLVQQIGDWISLQNVSQGSRGDTATQSEAEETAQFETSSAQNRTEKQVLWRYEQLAELRTALSQARRLREPKRSEKIINWLRVPIDHQFIRFSLGLVVMFSTLLVLAYVLGQHQLQLRTTKATNGEPVRPSERSGASVTTEPTASNSPLLNPSFVPSGAILLQVAALTRERDALALAEILGQKKYPAFVRMSGAGDYYRVQVGPYLDAASARSARRRLEKDGFKAIVKR